MFLASSLDELRELYSEKLKAMLSPDELGAYILVLANSMQDDELHHELEDALVNNKKILTQSIENNSLDATQDDLDVFDKLRAIGPDKISSWSKHQVGVWQVMSNPFRSLRPSRVSSEKIKSIQRCFDDEAFNFNKPFLKPEILWEGKWLSGSKHPFNLKVLYNKFPFIPYHLLIVPNPELQCVQYLTPQYHEMIWDLVSETNINLPGFGVGYNSLGACASVNHLHFQGFVLSSHLPIELSQWSHNGGDIEYPMRCSVSGNKEKAWAVIQGMHDNDVPYNLLYRPDCCYVIPRQIQGSESIDEAVAGAGWIDECGVFVAANLDEINDLTEAVITANLKSLST